MEGNLLFVPAVDSNCIYSWYGGTYENLIHGDGVLYKTCSMEICDSQHVHAYYGTIDRFGMENISEQEQYIGEKGLRITMVSVYC